MTADDNYKITKPNVFVRVWGKGGGGGGFGVLNLSFERSKRGRGLP